MLSLLRFCRVAAAIGALATSGTALAADEGVWPPPGVSFYGDPKVPDISGVWLGTMTGRPGVAFGPNRGPADGRPPTYWAPAPLPYTPAYQKIATERVEAAKKGHQLGDLSAKCLPFGLPMMLSAKVYPDEIVQTPGEVTFFMFNTVPIMVWTDGRGHPRDLAPSYNGHSIGYWVGDTLYVDTVGILGTTPLDAQRDPHSAKIHLKWTVQRVVPDTLHVHLTMFDPDAFKEPVTTTNIWQRKTDPRWQILDDASCFENNKETEKNGAVSTDFIKF